MRTLKFALLIGPFLALAAAADVTKDDIRRLHVAGVSEDVIVAYVNSHRPVRISAEELAGLKTEGVGDKVLAALATSEPSTTPYVAPAQSDTTIYPSTTYYSYPSYGYGYPYYSYSYPRYYTPSLYFSYGYPSYSHHHHGSYYHKPYYHGGHHHSGGYHGRYYGSGHHGGHSSGGYHGGGSRHYGGGTHGGKR